ncbi:MAG: hemolysin family protein [Candidatus Peribacteraceae bacterium]
MIELALLVTGFIVVSGFFAMIDAAILNVTPAEVEELITKKKWGAKALKSLLRRTTRAIIVIVIFTNVTNILGPILAGKKAMELFGNEAIGYMTALLTFATIIFSEIIPKSIGAHSAPRISRRIAPVLQVFIIVFYPLIIVLERLVRLFKSGKRKVGTEEQIRALANIGGGAGHIDADERELIHRAFVLNDRKVKDIMTPVQSMVCISRSSNVRQGAKLIFAHHYSRYPMVGNSLDDIQGYILSRDVLEALADGKGEESVSCLLRELLTVDASLACDELLNVLRRNDAQLVVVAEHEKTVGLVTLEDVLEELVGEIRDEGDV